MRVDVQRRGMKWALGLALAALCAAARAEPAPELSLMGLGDSGPWKVLATAPLAAGAQLEVGEAKSGQAWARVSLQNGQWLVELGCGRYDIDYRPMKIMGSNKGAEPIGRCSGSWVKAIVGPSMKSEVIGEPSEGAAALAK